MTGSTAISSREDLTPRDLAVLYWSKLGAPVERVARVTRSTREEVMQAYARLASLHPNKVQTSHIAGYPSETPWADRCVNAIIEQALAKPADTHAIIVADEGNLTVGDLRHSLSLVSAGLQAKGIGRGASVAVDASQRIESYLVAVAALMLGATVIRLSLAEGHSGVMKSLGAAPAQMTFTSCARELAGFANSGTVIELSTPERKSSGFDEWFGSLNSDGSIPHAQVKPSDIALVGFTSGSMGQPKCILTSHEAVFRSSEAMQQLFRFQPDDVFCTSTDFSALSGFRSMLTMPFLSGGRLLLPSAQGRQDPIALAKECEAFGVTQLTAVPSALRSMAKASHRLPRINSLRRVFSGSGVLDQSTRDEVFAAFNVPVVDYYASREFGTAAYASDTSGKTITSAGGQICGAVVLISDDNGNAVPVGAVGEIMVHSDCLTDSELAGTHPAWRGWHQSGDLGCINSDGTLRVLGRKRDVIKARDGSLVFPVEIETLINALPAVKESCVFGVLGPGGAEIILAVVIPTQDTVELEDEVRRHILQSAGKHRVPAKVFSVSDFPRVASRKINKAALQQQLAKDLRRFQEGT